MSDKLLDALVGLLPVLCGGLIGSGASIVIAFYTDLRVRQRMEKELLRERKLHNITKIEVYLDSRISQIKSLTNPPININTIIEYLQSELWKQAGSGEAARASAWFLGDVELAKLIAKLENMFLKIWDLQKQASSQQDLPELENEAIEMYIQCAHRVEVLKGAL